MITDEPGEFPRGRDPGLVVDPGERLAGVEGLAVPVVLAMVVLGELGRLRVPPAQQAAGQRHPGDDARPRPVAAAGSTYSSGLRRKAFRMICTVAMPRREIAVSASSQVSTLTPYAAMAPR